MTSKLTREQLIKKAQEQIEFCRHTNITGEGRAHVNQCAALFEIALAAMDSEPVAVIDQANLDYLSSGADADVWPPQREEMGDVLLYRHAQPESGLELAGWQFKSVNGDWLGIIDEHGKNRVFGKGCC